LWPWPHFPYYRPTLRACESIPRGFRLQREDQRPGLNFRLTAEATRPTDRYQNRDWCIPCYRLPVSGTGFGDPVFRQTRQN